MTLYIRVGNETVTQAQLDKLTSEDLVKINSDKIHADTIRQNNIAESMGLKKAVGTVNLVPNISPGSEVHKALLEDMQAKAAAEAPAPVQSAQEVGTPVAKKKSPGRPKKQKPAQLDQAQAAPEQL